MIAVSLFVSALALPACNCGEDDPPVTPIEDDSELTVTPSMGSFGSLAVGETSASTTFTVTNEGAGTSAALSLAISGAAAADFAMTSGCDGAELDTDETCTFDVTFTPTAEGARSATLTISDDNAVANPTVGLSGNGAAAGALSISPTPHDFGTVAVGTTSTAVDFVVTNEGSAATAGLTTMISGAGAIDFEVVEDTCGDALEGEGTCTVTVAFAPNSPGAKTANLNVVAGDQTAVAAISGNAVVPAQITVTPGTQQFGTVVVGDTSGDFTFNVTNAGGESTGALAVALGGADAGSFNITTNACDGATLAGGASCTIIATFSPSATGMAMATLDITGTPGGTGTANLTGEGVAEGSIEIDPSPHDFGNATVGTAGDTQTFTITNGGGADVGPLTTVTGGTHPTNFQIVGGTNGCQGVTLSAGGVCTLAIQFSPSAEGARNAALNVTGAGGVSATASLSGTGDAVVTPAVLEVTPATQPFGTVLIGQSSPATPFTITNTGGSASGVPNVTLGGANFSQFTIAGNGCTTTLAPGEDCVVNVTFDPSAPAGDKSASLNISGTPGGTASATLLGTALATGALSPNPPSLQFGQVVNGGTTATLSVVITNNGGAATGAIATGLSSTEFEISSDTCAGNSVAPGDTCTLQIRFSPDTIGVKSETLSIDATPGGSFEVALTGDSLPEFTITPAPETFDYGAHAIGTSTGQAFTVTNTAGTGSTPRIITATSDSNQFVVTVPAGCGNVTPGNNCTVTVDFEPTGTPGARNGTITFTDDTGASYTRNVIGEALGPIQIAPDPLAFGDTVINTTVDLPVTVTNTASTATGTIDVDISGGSNFGIVSQNCAGATLAANGGNCTITIRYYPTAVGDHTGTLSVNDALGSGDTSTLTGTGVTPGTLTVMGDNDFGVVTQTNTNEQTYNITNTGSLSAAVSVSLNNTVGNYFSITANTCINALSVLAPGQMCAITVTFAPDRTALPSDVPLVFNAPTYAATLTISGQARNLTGDAESQMSITPNPGVFGDQIVGTTSAAESFTLTNRSDNNTITNPLLAAGMTFLPGSVFPNTYNIVSNDCGTIAPGASCTIDITFSPTVVGDADGGLVVCDAGGTANCINNALAWVTLDGEGINDITLSIEVSDILHFGYAERETTGATKTVTVRNNGSRATEGLSVLTSGLGGHTNAGFSVTNGCSGTQLAAGAECVLTITFAPGATTSLGLVDFEISANATNFGGGPVTQLVEGIVVDNTADRRLRIEPGVLQFEDTVEGQVSAVQTFAVRNIGNLTSGPITLTAGGLQSNQFCFGATCAGPALADNCSGQTVNANQTCTFEARFEPDLGQVGELQGEIVASAAAVSGFSWVSASTRLQGNSLSVASLSIAPADLNDPNIQVVGPPDRFIDTAVGASTDVDFLITNNGEDNTGAISATLTGVGAVHYAVTNNGCSGGIAGGATCVVTVAFSPLNEANNFSALLTVTPSNPDSVAGTRTLIGDGVSVAQLAVTPAATQDCGTEPAGLNPGSLCATFNIENVGGVPTGDITLSTSNDDFVISTTTCPDTNGDGILDALAAGDDCDVNVLYAPDSVSMLDQGTFTATAQPGGSDTGTLEGDSVSALSLTTPVLTPVGGNNGGGGTLAGDSSSYTYLGTDVGSHRTAGFQFTNAAGTEPTGPLTVTLDGADTAHYSIYASTCVGTVVAPGATCVVQVRFAPVGVQADLEVNLEVTDGTAEHTATLDLIGDGLSP